jgi:hypothetical protein
MVPFLLPAVAKGLATLVALRLPLHCSYRLAQAIAPAGFILLRPRTMVGWKCRPGEPAPWVSPALRTGGSRVPGFVRRALGRRIQLCRPQSHPDGVGQSLPGPINGRPFMNIGDKVVIQGMPGKVIDVDVSTSVPLYLVLIQTPSIRWLSEDQLRGPAGPGMPPMSPRPQGPVPVAPVQPPPMVPPAPAPGPVGPAR